MLYVAGASAEHFTSLLMPGPVINSHKKFEEDCDQCHKTSENKNQGQLCVQCHDHKNIREDLNNKTGFHGRLSKSQQTDCKHCHTEHEGRDINVVLLDVSTFDHRQTDFALKGTHTKVPCTACHKSNKEYSEAPSKCYSCHKEEDAHEGKQGEKCESCHKPINWKETGFDHDETDFPLKDAHAKTSCNACHLNKKYEDTPKDCFSCHQISDVHRGEYGKKCDTCHNSKKWAETRFDHDKKTDFPLYGRHKKADCSSCHIAGSGKTMSKKGLPTNCYSCHKNDDAHKGRNGNKCSNCHKSSSWEKQTFNHSKKTDFPLLGKHSKVSCNACHKGDLYKEELSTKCIDCHKKDDVHKGRQGKNCNSCHNEKGWHNNVIFDHDITDFPLIGIHVAAQCEECHLDAEYGATPSGCNDCHADVDVHKTRLGTDCETCHSPNSWYTWFFDHDKATRFTIDGAHEDLGCYDCHRTSSKGKLKASKDCIACHRGDDVHNRQFGGQCDDCHNTNSFKGANIK